MVSKKEFKGTISQEPNSKNLRFQGQIDNNTESTKVELTGDRWGFLVVVALAMFITTCAHGELSNQKLQKANELEQQKNEILRQQLQQAKRQYALDSLQFYSNLNSRLK